MVPSTACRSYASTTADFDTPGASATRRSDGTRSPGARLRVSTRCRMSAITVSTRVWPASDAMTGTLIRTPLWTSTVWAIRTLSYLATGRSLRQHRRHGHSILPSHPAGAGGFGQRLGQRFPGHGDLQRLAAGAPGGGPE